MNKGPGGQQLFFWPGWYTAPNQDVVVQKNVNSDNKY